MKISEYVNKVVEEFEEFKFKEAIIIEFDLGISIDKKEGAVLDHYSQNRIKFKIKKK